MGTKNDPGPYDCHTKALDDEPLFTAIARDWRAPFIVEAWAAMYVGDFAGAHEVISEARRAFMEDQEKQSAARYYDRGKSVEAQQCAQLMRAWRSERTEAELVELAKGIDDEPS